MVPMPERADGLGPSTIPSPMRRVAEFRALSFAFLAALAIACGVGLRMQPLGSAFPWFDGGLFAQIVDQLRAGSLLPTQVAVNGGEIPFVYPPFAFQLAALIGQVTGAATLDLLRWIPVIASIAVLGAFWLAISSLFDRRSAMLATAVFALMPSSFDRLIAGGGLTRGLGLCFALLAWASVGQYNRTRRVRWLVAAGVASGLSAMTHPMAAVLAGAGTLLLLRPSGSLHHWLRSVVLVALVSVLVILPWLALIIARGQLSALVVGGGQRYEPLLAVLTLFVSFVQPDSIAGAVGIIGFFVMLLQHRWYVLAVTAVCVLGPGWFFSTIGLALCGGVMLAELQQVPHPTSTLVARVWFAVVLAVGVLGSALTGLVYDKEQLPNPAAMQWIAENTPPAQRFIVTSSELWSSDLAAEWFPYIAQRPSLLTIQGTEWLGPTVFEGRVSEHERMRACVADADPSCLRDLAADLGVGDAWLFVTPDSGDLLVALAASNRYYHLMFSGDDGAVFAPSSNGS